MARPRAKHKNVKQLFTMPPLMKARLEAQALYETEQKEEEVPVAVLIRAGLEKYFRENPLPDGYLKEYIQSIEDEKEREELLQLLDKMGDSNGIFKP